MTKIDIFSGFLGAGKTTLIKKLIKEAYVGERLVLIENEFGEIGIDGGFLADAGIEITEMNSGCICCSLVGDFSKALGKVLDEYHPDRIIIEPSGVGKLSDVIKAASTVCGEEAELNAFTTVVDANKCKMYMKNFGEFFGDQIKHASCIVLSHTQTTKDTKLEEALHIIRENNADAVIVTTPWDALDGKAILAAMEQKDTLADDMEHLEHEHKHHHHEHHEECCCGHHHHEHDEHCECVITTTSTMSIASVVTIITSTMSIASAVITTTSTTRSVVAVIITTSTMSIVSAVITTMSTMSIASAVITTMSTMSIASVVIITMSITTNTRKAALAVATITIITIITQTRYSRALVRKLLRNLEDRSFTTFLKSSQKMILTV